MEDEKKCVDSGFPIDERPADDVLQDDGFNNEVKENLEEGSHLKDSEYIVEESVSEETDGESSNPQDNSPPGAEDCNKRIGERLQNIEDTERRLFSEVREMHKLYHSEFAGRLKTMQDELEQYRKIDKGRVYDDILGAIARIYGNNETLEEEVADAKAKKSIRYMLLDIEDLLSVYGMTKLRTQQGEKRNPRHCQILNRIPMDDPAKHDTVAKSYNSGFYIGNRTVIKEVVDVYIYEGQSILEENEDKQLTEAEDASNKD